jgi:glycolate oxidase FAD binding subunit
VSAVGAAAVVRPGDLGEARAALRDSAEVVWFRGGGTKLDWGAAGQPPGVVVDTRGLDRIVEHSAGDMIAVVQPGLALADLQRALAGSGQRLALDPPGEAAGATIGGLFATDDAGPLRHRFGTLRDLAIGVTAVLADGTVFHAGGKVVKNVAGFDLVRLLCGSLGTLALVTELVVRLHPVPETVRTVRVPADAATATRLTLALAAAPIVPAAVDWHGGALLVRLEGRPAGVAAQAGALRQLVAAPCDDLDDAAAGDAWAAVARAHRGEDGETVVRAATPVSALAGTAGALRRAAAVAGVEAELSSHAGWGLHTARLRGGGAGAHAEVVRAWRRAVAAQGGTVVLRRRLDGVDALVDPWYDEPAQAPSALAVMRRVKAQLDPGGRCAPGRFVGGI